MTERLTYESIYDDPYEGDTYNFGIAYLRAETTDHESEEFAEPYPDLDEQRHVIQSLARAAATLIVAEFIDECGPITAEERPALNELLDYWQDTHPAVMFAASERVLAFDTHDSFWFRASLNADRPESLITGGD